MKRSVLVFAAILAATVPAGAQWPQFRGPDGMGVAPAAKVPLTWGEGQNVRWKTAIHGRAWSSPIVLGAADLGHDRDAGRTSAVRARARSRDRQDHSRREALRRREAAVRPCVQLVRVTDPRHRTGTRVRDIRIAGHRRARYEDGQGAVGAARSGVQPFSRRGLVGGDLREPPADALRRQRSAVRRRPRQEHGQDRVEDRRARSTSRTSGRMARSRPTATSGRDSRRRRS